MYLKAAFSIAKALRVQQHGRSGRAESDAQESENSVREIERLGVAVESIAQDARNKVKKGVKIGKAADGVKERLVEDVERVVEGMGERRDNEGSRG